MNQIIPIREYNDPTEDSADHPREDALTSTESSTATAGKLATVMPSHTPGPWRVSHEADGVWVDAGGYPLCRVRAAKPTTEDDANARLIAAAPDMLAALQEIVARNEIQHWFNLDQARAAIARATGVTS